MASPFYVNLSTLFKNETMKIQFNSFPLLIQEQILEKTSYRTQLRLAQASAKFAKLLENKRIRAVFHAKRMIIDDEDEENWIVEYQPEQAGSSRKMASQSWVKVKDTPVWARIGNLEIRAKLTKSLLDRILESFHLAAANVHTLTVSTGDDYQQLLRLIEALDPSMLNAAHFSLPSDFMKHRCIQKLRGLFLCNQDCDDEWLLNMNFRLLMLLDSSISAEAFIKYLQKWQSGPQDPASLRIQLPSATISEILHRFAQDNHGLKLFPGAMANTFLMGNDNAAYLAFESNRIIFKIGYG